jgi:hypothetical protein
MEHDALSLMLGGSGMIEAYPLIDFSVNFATRMQIEQRLFAGILIHERRIVHARYTTF